MSAQHTPGPWNAFYKHKYNEWHVSVPTGGGMNLALFADGVPTANPEQDAHLISAAPDLLEALELLHNNLAEYQKLNHLGGYDNQDMCMARAAIAKAKGAK